MNIGASRGEGAVTTTPDVQCGQTALTAQVGMVTANHRLAAGVGAAVLAGGGNAIDAAPPRRLPSGWWSPR